MWSESGIRKSQTIIRAYEIGPGIRDCEQLQRRMWKRGVMVVERNCVIDGLPLTASGVSLDQSSAGMRHYLSLRVHNNQKSKLAYTAVLLLELLHDAQTSIFHVFRPFSRSRSPRGACGDAPAKASWRLTELTEWRPVSSLTSSPKLRLRQLRDIQCHEISSRT